MKAATGMWAMSSVILSTWVITLSTLSRYLPKDGYYAYALDEIHFGGFRGSAAVGGASVSAPLASVYTWPRVRGAPVVGIAVDEVDSNNRLLFLWTCIHRRGAKWCWDCCCWGLVQPHSTGGRCCCLSCCCWSWLESVSQLWCFSLSSGAQQTLEMFLKGFSKPINIQVS